MIKNMHFAGRHTLAYHFLEKAARPEGVAPTPRRGHVPGNQAQFAALFKQGLVEVRCSGPRGGERFHVTSAGLAALTWHKYPPTEVPKRHKITE